MNRLRDFINSNRNKTADLRLVAIGILAIQWIGWLHLTQLFLVKVATPHLKATLEMQGAYSWVVVPEELKVISLLQYGLAALGLGCAWGLSLWLRSRSKDPSRPAQVSVLVLGGITFVSLVTNVLLYAWPPSYELVLLWLLVFAVLAYLGVPQGRRVQLVDVFGLWIPPLLFAGFLIGVIGAMIAGVDILKNDYLEIPEISLFKDGTRVDKLDFINQHQLDGLEIYDPRTHLAQTSAVAEQISTPCPRDAYVDFLVQSDPQHFEYDIATGRLSMYGVLKSAEIAEIISHASSPPVVSAIKDLLTRSAQRALDAKRHVDSAAETEFASNNAYELGAQFALGRFFYHQNYLYGPILAISLGIESKQVPMIYGYGTTAAFAGVLAAMGGVTFDHYFSAFYSIYVLYALIALACVWVVFPRRDVMALACAGLLLAYLLPGYEDLLQAPGFNPVRHLFDLILFVAIFKFAGKGNPFTLAIVVLVSILSVWWSKEFGMTSVLCALISLGAIAAIFPARRQLSGIGALLVAIGAVGTLAWLGGHGAPSILTKYSLAGVSAPTISNYLIDETLIVIALVLAAVTLFFSQSRRTLGVSERAALCTAVGVASYVVAGGLYVIWYPSTHHLAPLVPAATFLLVLIIRASLPLLPDERAATTTIRCAATAVCALAIVTGSAFLTELKTYHRSNLSHAVYDWKFATLHMRSTADPALFEEAVATIGRYATDPSVVVISRYSHLLPLLSGHYNLVGLPELESTLLTPREVDVASATIETSKPKFIFVDTDIEANRFGEILDRKSSLGMLSNLPDLSDGREKALSVLNELFKAEAPHYRLVERGNLLSVYERIDS